MMSFPQQLNPSPIPANQLTGMLPPKGATITAVDLAAGFAPQWIALTRASWERTVLTRIQMDGEDVAVMPMRDGDHMIYSLPLVNADRVRRLTLTWSNQGRSGTQFTYQLLSERPGIAPVPAAVPAPAVGALVPHPLAPPPAPLARPAMAPMSPPAIPLASVGVPAVSAPLMSSPMAAVAAMAYPTAPLVGASPALPAHPLALPVVGGPMAQTAMAVQAVQAPLPPPPPADPGTEQERHVAAVFSLSVQDIRDIARGLAEPARFTGDQVLQTYVDNFGSAGLEMIPRQWIEQARRTSQTTGVNGQYILAGTVLHSLIERMAEDRQFEELRRTGGGGQAPGDFVVSAQVTPATQPPAPPVVVADDTKPPETERNGLAAVPRATGAHVQAMAKVLNVDPGWLLVVTRTVAQARQVSPDLVVQLATASTLKLLVERFTEAATEEVQQRLAQAVEAKALEPTPESETPASPDLDKEAANRKALIEQNIATRSVDWLAQQAQIGAL